MGNGAEASSTTPELCSLEREKIRRVRPETDDLIPIKIPAAYGLWVFVRSTEGIVSLCEIARIVCYSGRRLSSSVAEKLFL